MNDQEIDEVWMAHYKVEHYLLPFSSGEFMVYHHGPNRFATGTYVPYTHYEIIRPKKFRIKLYYEDALIKLSKDSNYSPYTDLRLKQFVEIPMQIKLEDYFEIRNWRGRDIPISLKRFETEYKVERLFNLFVFT